MDVGKFKYEAAQKVREARKNQVNTVLKTVRFGLKIDDHDYGTKRGQIELRQQETFAPILYVLTYRELDEAIALLRTKELGMPLQFNNFRD